jgi:hypothetical protein
MWNVRLVFVVLAVSVFGACARPEPPPPPPDPCPNIDIEKLAGDWMQVKQDKADPTNRFRILGNYPDYEAVLVPGDMQKYTLGGRLRKDKGDVVFDEVLSPEAEARFKNGQRWKARLQVEPNKKKCSLRVGVITVTMNGDKETEKRRPPGYEEYVPLPKEGGVEFTFEPCTGPLFLGPAAKNRKEAEKQLKANHGVPDPSQSRTQALPVGVFTTAGDDGDASCTYDMDLYFDDRPLADKKKLPAGKVDGGFRHWFVGDWYAQYTGAHSLEMYRYRTCADGKRERIGVQCILSVLD